MNLKFGDIIKWYDDIGVVTGRRNEGNVWCQFPDYSGELIAEKLVKLGSIYDL